MCIIYSILPGSTVCSGKTKTLGPKRGNVKLENYWAPLKEIFNGNAQNYCAFPLKFDTFETSSFLSFTFPRLATDCHLPHVFIYCCVLWFSTKTKSLFRVQRKLFSKYLVLRYTTGVYEVLYRTAPFKECNFSFRKWGKVNMSLGAHSNALFQRSPPLCFALLIIPNVSVLKS